MTKVILSVIKADAAAYYILPIGISANVLSGGYEVVKVFMNNPTVSMIYRLVMMEPV